MFIERLMCFSSEASLVAFMIGTIACVYLLSQKHYLYFVFAFSIVIIQLWEFLGHQSIKNKKADLNRFSSKLILTVFLQPIIYVIALNLFPPNNTYPLFKNLFYLSLLVLVVYFLNFFFYYRNLVRNKSLNVSYLRKCGRVCRLKWNFFITQNILGFNFIILYLLIFAVNMAFYTFNQVINITNSVLVLLLLLSLLFIYFQDKIKKNTLIISSFGSLWCFLAVCYPLLLCLYSSFNLI